jgi:hypothetical protein
MYVVCTIESLVKLQFLGEGERLGIAQGSLPAEES